MTKSISRFTHPGLISQLGFSLVTLILTVSPASADILATSYSNGSGSGLIIASGGPDAQQFTLLSSATITSVDAAVEGIVQLSGLTMTIVNNSSGAPGNTVLATDSSDSGTPDKDSYVDLNFAFNSASLSAGTYWLVLSDNAGPGAGETWESQTPGTPNPAGEGGTINNRIANSGNAANGTFLTTINGTLATSTPEPATILVSCGALAVTEFRRRVHARRR